MREHACNPFLGYLVRLHEQPRRADLQVRGDLVFDPNEANNLIDDPRYADVLADLRGAFRWMAQTADPLRAGHVGLRRGPRSNLPDQRSASEPTTRVG